MKLHYLNLLSSFWPKLFKRCISSKFLKAISNPLLVVFGNQNTFWKIKISCMDCIKLVCILSKHHRYCKLGVFIKNLFEFMCDNIFQKVCLFVHHFSLLFLPHSLKGCAGIVLSHGAQMGHIIMGFQVVGWVGGRKKFVRAVFQKP